MTRSATQGLPTMPSGVRLAVVGLGHVGLPLAVEFGKAMDVVGFDVNGSRVKELSVGNDVTLEVSDDLLAQATGLHFTHHPEDLEHCNVYIVTTPTPIDAAEQPDLTPVLAATESIAKVLAPGDVVIYESTVYPGATEEQCVPVLEEISRLKLDKDFFVGCSPERINPGGKEHPLTTMVKVTSGSTPEAADFVDELYSSIVPAGTHRASSIRVAEAAKVIENTQRDVNIALIDELAILFNRLDINTEEVLRAAGSRWDFPGFRPGLVGAHRIGVDPYHLTETAQAAGHHPEIIPAGRRLNDSMGSYIAARLVKRLTKEGIRVRNARVLMLGLIFDENTADLHYSHVVDILDELAAYEIDVDVHDPRARAEEAKLDYGVGLVPKPEDAAYDAVIVAVAHREFLEMGTERIRAFGKPEGHILYDLTYVLDKTETDLRL